MLHYRKPPCNEFHVNLFDSIILVRHIRSFNNK